AMRPALHPAVLPVAVLRAALLRAAVVRAAVVRESPVVRASGLFRRAGEHVRHFLQPMGLRCYRTRPRRPLHFPPQGWPVPAASRRCGLPTTGHPPRPAQPAPPHREAAVLWL